MYVIPTLPADQKIETIAVLRGALAANRRLAELKGVVGSMPNASILINTLMLQEAKDSSEIESIVTTHDELYKAELFAERYATISSKEVISYSEALKCGFELVKERSSITNNTIIEIYQHIKHTNAGFRNVPGTNLVNEKTGEIVYEPPQHRDQIASAMNNLEEFINIDEMSDLDPLIKMAVIHHQFESIHPFSDGNGRTGRIINILYLVKSELLELPVLYLSRYIIRNKGLYYKLLQEVRDTGQWEKWLLFMLRAVEETSVETIALVRQIKCLMQEFKISIRETLPRIYSQDLINNLFRHPYTKIEFVMNELGVSRPTASHYLALLHKNGNVEKIKLGRENFYVNVQLFDLLRNAFHMPQEEMPSVESKG